MQVIGIIMVIVTSLTFILPDSINRRKPTLREFAQAQHDQLEAESVELVTLKTLEHSNESEEKGDARASSLPGQIVPSAPKDQGKLEDAGAKAVVEVNVEKDIKEVNEKVDEKPAETTVAVPPTTTTTPAGDKVETLSS